MLCLVLAFAWTPAAADTPSPSAAPGLRSPGPYPGPQGAPGPAAGELLRAAREAEGAIRKAAGTAAQIARRRADARYAEAWKDEAPEGIVATATQAIAAARGRLEQGKNLGQVKDLQEALRLATSARKDLEALAGRLDDLLARQAVRDLLIDQVRRQAQDKAATQKAAARMAAAQRAVAEKVAAERAAAEKAAAERVVADKATADRLVAEQERAAKLAREQETARTEAESREHAQPEHLAREISRRQPGPPPELRAAARALFRADYEEVVHFLADAAFAERRAAVTAALLLAAARYSLYLEGGERDLGLRRQARENARTCRRLAPALSPDPRLFSPRFVQFFRSAG